VLSQAHKFVFRIDHAIVAVCCSEVQYVKVCAECCSVCCHVLALKDGTVLSPKREPSMYLIAYASGRTDFARWKIKPKSAISILQVELADLCF